MPNDTTPRRNRRHGALRPAITWLRIATDDVPHRAITLVDDVKTRERRSRLWMHHRIWRATNGTLFLETMQRNGETWRSVWHVEGRI